MNKSCENNPLPPVWPRPRCKRTGRVMHQLIMNLLNGLSFGMILFLLAMGLSITFGVMGILNLTHGALFMIGGFTGLSVILAGGNFWLALLVGSICAGVAGIIIEQLFLTRLYRRLDEQVLLTLGLVYVIENIAFWIYGGTSRIFKPPQIFQSSMAIGDYHFPVYRLALIAIGGLVFLFLWWLIERTKIGSIVRAGMDDKEMTLGLGLNYKLICMAVFALGTFISGFAGVLATPVLGILHSISMDILLYALIVIIVGGPGSVLGTLIGALIIGIVDAFGKAYFPSFAMFTIYVVFILMLIVKPTGIMGKKFV